MLLPLAAKFKRNSGKKRRAPVGQSDDSAASNSAGHGRKLFIISSTTETFVLQQTFPLHMRTKALDNEVCKFIKLSQAECQVRFRLFDCDLKQRYIMSAAELLLESRYQRIHIRIALA